MKSTLLIAILLSLITPTLTAHLNVLQKSLHIQPSEEIEMELTHKKCKACEGGVKPLSIKDEDDYLAQVPNWDINREDIHKIERTFKFKDFVQALNFVNMVGTLAEDEGHHPDITIFYNRVILDLYTHAIKGLSENDFILASKIDALIQNVQNQQSQS